MVCKCILNKTEKAEINKNWPQWDLRGRHSAIDMLMSKNTQNK